MAAESALGAGVASELPQTGGFSPGLASRLVLDDGRRVFAKATNAVRNPHSPGLYRREIEVMAALPATVPAPGLRWSYDDGDWVMVVLDDVEDVMPAQPWDRREFARVLTALEQLSDVLTPAPVAAMSIVDDLVENFRSWRTIAADAAVAATNSIDVEQAWNSFGPARSGDPDAVNAVLAAVAGDFVYQSLLPAPVNLPTLRGHQQAKGAAALSWLRSRIS